MKSHLSFLFLLFLMAFITFPLQAENKISATTSPNNPISHWKMDGVMVGVVPDLFKIIFKELNIPYTYMTYPWKRALLMGERGDVDLIGSIYHTKERTKFLAFTIPWRTDSVYYAAEKESGIKLNTLDDLVGLNVITRRGDAFSQGFEKIRPKLKIQELDNYGQALLFLGIRGGRQIVVGAQYQLMEKIIENGLTDKIEIFLLPARDWEKKQSVHMAISLKSKHKNLVPSINKIIEKLKKSGELDKILIKNDMLYKKYLSRIIK